MTENDIRTALSDVVRAYPPEMRAVQTRDIPRIAFNIHLSVGDGSPTGCSICDIGGGVGLFAPGCAALGMKSLLIDDFADPINKLLGNAPFMAHNKFGVQVLSRDVIREGIGDIDEKFDVVTTFDSMEHWHHSPKSLFSQVRNSLLRPGGRFVLGVPNCVNLRKRVSVPFGIGKWSQMEEWYEQAVFRSHVR